VTGVVRPTFFIVGAPKSGTTSMHRSLRRHPQVFMPERKEPHYFCPDLFSPRYTHDEGAYLALFTPGAGQAAVGEASVYYLYSREAARRIQTFAPDAKIVIMLRNPVDMIYSLHSQRLYSGHEELEDFEAALAAEPARRAGRQLPPNPYPIPCLFYREIGKYAVQVERYLDVFPSDQVHVIIFEDFVRDTPGAFAGLCRFLDITPGVPPAVGLANPNKHVRSRRLRAWLKFSPMMQTLARRSVPRPLRRRLGGWLFALNTNYEPRRPMRADLRAQLQDEFAPDVVRLSALLGRDLTYWSKDQADAGVRPERLPSLAAPAAERRSGGR
jgi:hypothetical protein